MSVLAVIPARYASERLPGKPLLDLGGKPMILHVVDRAREVPEVDEAIVATDDERIACVVRAHGVRAVLTSPDCPSGTDRIAEVVAAEPEAEIVVNIQGDEPLMPPAVVSRAIAALRLAPDCAVATAMIPIASEADFLSPNVVKVVCDLEGRALTFSRAPIPSLARMTNDATAALLASTREREGDSALPPGAESAPFWGFKHFGLYVYRREALERFVVLQPSPLERLERLEQMRLMENGLKIRVITTTLDSVGVDTPEDLEAVRRIVERR